MFNSPIRDLRASSKGNLILESPYIYSLDLVYADKWQRILEREFGRLLLVRSPALSIDANMPTASPSPSTTDIEFPAPGHTKVYRLVFELEDLSKMLSPDLLALIRCELNYTYDESFPVQSPISALRSSSKGNLVVETSHEPAIELAHVKKWMPILERNFGKLRRMAVPTTTVSKSKKTERTTDSSLVEPNSIVDDPQCSVSNGVPIYRRVFKAESGPIDDLTYDQRAHLLVEVNSTYDNGFPVKTLRTSSAGNLVVESPDQWALATEHVQKWVPTLERELGKLTLFKVRGSAIDTSSNGMAASNSSAATSDADARPSDRMALYRRVFKPVLGPISKLERSQSLQILREVNQTFGVTLSKHIHTLRVSFSGNLVVQSRDADAVSSYHVAKWLPILEREFGELTMLNVPVKVELDDF